MNSPPCLSQRPPVTSNTKYHIRHLGVTPSGEVGEWFEVGAVLIMKSQLEAIERVATRVAESNAPAYEFGEKGLQLTAPVQALWSVMNGMDDVPESILEGRRLNVQLKFLIPWFRKWYVRLLYWKNPDNGLALDHEYPRRMMSHAVYVIRRLLNSKKFKAAMAKGQRRARDRYASCVPYVLDIFRMHSKVMVFRVDLYFEGEGKLQSLSPEARAAFDKFLRHLDEGRIIPGVKVHYIDVAEDGLERRLHHHFLGLCDGNLHQNVYRIGEALGKYWVEQCVGSPVLASYFNCWHRRHEYRFNCIGVVHHTDTKMMMGMREAIEYMVKDEPHTYLREGSGKGMRKGESPWVPGEVRRGAPRACKDDLALAKVVLLEDADPVPAHLRPRPPRRRLTGSVG